MANLPTVEFADVATKSDIESLRSDMRSDFASLRNDMRSDFTVVHQRIDRLFITLVTGLFVIVAAMAGMFAATIG